MKSFAIFVLFVGTILVIQGYYSDVSSCPKPPPVIKFVPRSTYDEQLSDGEDLNKYYTTIFEQTNLQI